MMSTVVFANYCCSAAENSIPTQTADVAARFFGIRWLVLVATSLRCLNRASVIDLRDFHSLRQFLHIKKEKHTCTWNRRRM